MLEWLSNYSGLLSALISACMLIVWVVYLNTFVSNYRRQVLPKIVINRGAGAKLQAHCFISNMSSEPIYIESIIASLESGGESWSCAVTDIETLLGDESATGKQKTHQGPLGRGDYMDIGSFHQLLKRVLRVPDNDTPSHLDQFEDEITAEVKVIADYASEDLMIAALRRYKLHRMEDGWEMEALSVSTDQIRSKSERRHIHNMLRPHV